MNIYINILQVILLLLSRILQTASATALEIGDPTSPSIGYLCKCGSDNEDFKNLNKAAGQKVRPVQTTGIEKGQKE